MKAGITSGPLPQNETKRSATLDPLTAPPFPLKEATVKERLQNLPKTTGQTTQTRHRITRGSLSQSLHQVHAKPVTEDQITERVWAQSANHDITNRCEVKGEVA